jgi:type II pantothenate kinase
LLTKVKTFDEVEKLCAVGHNSNIDLLVSDIYGNEGSDGLGLPGGVIASSFGKIGSVHHVHEPAEPSEYESADVIRSLFFMITNNVTQIAYLNAEKQGVNRIYFGGGFIKKNPYVMNRLAYGINFWSKGKMEALFLKHDGYLGALGTFLAPENSHGLEN